MSIIFGTNTVMSTWRNAIPLMCPPESHQLSEKISRVISQSKELGIIEDETKYSEFIKIFNKLDTLCDFPLTIFAFDDAMLKYHFNNMSDYELYKLASSHIVKGMITEDLIEDKVVRLSPISRKKFHITNDKIFQFIDRVPTVVSNIFAKNTILENGIVIYFIDYPIFNRQNLLLDDFV